MAERRAKPFEDPECGPSPAYIEHEADEERKARRRREVEGIVDRIDIVKQRGACDMKHRVPPTPVPSDEDAREWGPVMMARCVYLVETWRRVDAADESKSMMLSTAIMDIAVLLDRIEKEKKPCSG